MKKKMLAKKAGFDFEEIKNILSEETLSNLEQKVVKGGDITFTVCGCVKDCLCAVQDNTCKGM